MKKIYIILAMALFACVAQVAVGQVFCRIFYQIITKLATISIIFDDLKPEISYFNRKKI
ncbi:MAG: hypothetical protein IPO21_10780 [Bacteroidales bacterium]|nr:hypothetical protein [Bacteroidales bacterium]